MFKFKELNSDVYLYISIFVIFGSLIEILTVFGFRDIYNNYLPQRSAPVVPRLFSFVVIMLSSIILFIASLYSKQYGIISEEFEAREGANKQVISSQADSLIKISRIWADF
ncbi:hypothetical protein, partial [Enterobacter hormaechei]|uniref:hypothetical protein n=1 Tax=Enterobacter hormaechei TaxID=158836 RepID=UPI001C9609AD